MRKHFLALGVTLGLCLGLFAPAQAAAPETFQTGRTQSVELGDSVTFVLQEDGALWGWGGGNGDAYFLLGAGDTYEQAEDLGLYGTYYSQETPLKLLDGVAQVCTGTPYATPFTTVVKTDGSLWYTGQDTATFQKLAEGVSQACSLMRYDEEDASRGYFDIYAVKEDQELWRYTMRVTYGSGYGNKEEMIWQEPEKLMEGVQEVRAGYDHLLALKTDGSVWAWGDSSMGQLGNGQRGMPDGGERPEQTWTDTPVMVMDHVASIVASWNLSAAIRTDGTLWVWGETFGEDLDAAIQARPVKVADQVVQAHHNENYMTFVKEDGSVWVWGENPLDESVDCLETPADTGISGATLAAGSTQGLFRGIYYRTADGSLWFRGKQSSDLSRMVTIQMTGKSAAGSAPTFADVSAGAYYADAVSWAVGQGITSGTSATTFSPDMTCTTAQILTFLWRANGSPAAAGDHSFPDVAADAYYAQAAAWAYEKGLISGSTFGGDIPATRAATVTYLWKLAGKPAADAADFADVDAGAEYAQAVAWAVKAGITAGTSSTTFAPDLTCTRGQIMTFLYRDLAK